MAINCLYLGRSNFETLLYDWNISEVYILNWPMFDRKIVVCSTLVSCYGIRWCPFAIPVQSSLAFHQPDEIFSDGWLTFWPAGAAGKEWPTIMWLSENNNGVEFPGCVKRRTPIMRIIGAQMRCEIKLQTDGYDDTTNDDDYHIRTLGYERVESLLIVSTIGQVREKGWCWIWGIGHFVKTRLSNLH